MKLKESKEGYESVWREERKGRNYNLKTFLKISSTVIDLNLKNTFLNMS